MEQQLVSFSPHFFCVHTAKRTFARPHHFTSKNIPYIISFIVMLAKHRHATTEMEAVPSRKAEGEDKVLVRSALNTNGFCSLRINFRGLLNSFVRLALAVLWLILIVRIDLSCACN